MRLIDADALMKKVCGNCQRNDCTPDATDTVYGCMFDESINQMPTIEPEVRRGRWIIKRDEFYTAYNMYYAECSECKHTESTGMAERIKYCPNCGAQMDGGADNGE